MRTNTKRQLILETQNVLFTVLSILALPSVLFAAPPTKPGRAVAHRVTTKHIDRGKPDLLLTPAFLHSFPDRFKRIALGMTKKELFMTLGLPPRGGSYRGDANGGSNSVPLRLHRRVLSLRACLGRYQICALASRLVSGTSYLLRISQLLLITTVAGGLWLSGWIANQRQIARIEFYERERLSPAAR